MSSRTRDHRARRVLDATILGAIGGSTRSDPSDEMPPLKDGVPERLVRLEPKIQCFARFVLRETIVENPQEIVCPRE